MNICGNIFIDISIYSNGCIAKYWVLLYIVIFNFIISYHVTKYYLYVVNYKILPAHPSVGKYWFMNPSIQYICQIYQIICLVSFKAQENKLNIQKQACHQTCPWKSRWPSKWSWMWRPLPTWRRWQKCWRFSSPRGTSINTWWRSAAWSWSRSPLTLTWPLITR